MADKDLSFKLLSLLSKERGVYGLRNGDHERYRRHCANKIHRLRQVTGTTCGKGKTYKSPPKIDAASVKDVRDLQLVLFSAERALAHSHELKAIKTKPAAPANAQRDQVSWLRRALKLSTSLYEITQSIAVNEGGAKVNQQTLAEVTIYHLSIRAEYHFERSAWINALSDLAARRRLLSTLSEAAKDSYDEALANEFIDSFDPLIRFSAYKLGRKDSHDIDGVMADVDEEVMEEALPGLTKLLDSLRGETNIAEMEKGRNQLQDVEFAGEKVELRNAEIVQVMIKVQEVTGKLKEGKGKGMKGWDRVLGVLGEAEGVARKLLEDQEANGSSTSLRLARTTQSLTLAHQYIIYLLLSHRIQRDLLLVDTLSASLQKSLPADATKFKIPGGKVKVEEAVKGLGGIVKLYDTVVQSLRQAGELSVVQDKEGVRVGVEGLEEYFHATRLYNLARLHSVHPTPSFASAIQLLSRAALLVRQAKTNLVSPVVPVEEPILTVEPKSLEKLESEINALELAAKRGLFAQTVEKPVFFDTAFNYIDIPFDELEILAGKKERAATTTASVSDTVGAVTSNVVGSAKGAVEGVKKAVSRETRETTPAVETRPSSAVDGPEGGKKGWLGGWFGKK